MFLETCKHSAKAKLLRRIIKRFNSSFTAFPTPGRKSKTILFIEFMALYHFFVFFTLFLAFLLRFYAFYLLAANSRTDKLRFYDDLEKKNLGRFLKV